jgi:hypothetical protein
MHAELTEAQVDRVLEVLAEAIAAARTGGSR